MTDLPELSWAYRKFKVEAWAHHTKGRRQFILLQCSPLTRFPPHFKHIIYIELLKLFCLQRDDLFILL